MKKGILAKKCEWAKHLRPFGKRTQWSKERAAERSNIDSELYDLINGAEIVFDEHDTHNQEDEPQS